MQTRSAPAAAARTPAPDRPAAGRRPTSSLANQLDDLSYRLDNLIRDVRFGPFTHRQHDINVDEAEAIANDLRAAFRGKGTIR